MKSFMKFIVTLLVIVVVGYIAYYLVINNATDNNSNIDENSGENEEILSGEIIGNEMELPIISEDMSGEVSGEIIENNSGDENLEVLADSKEITMKNIDSQVIVINSGEILDTISDNLSSDLVSDSARKFMTYFKVNELSVTINIKERCVEIIPTSDFIENMVYYYDENGNLILYENVSNTVGGSTKYYFESGKSIDVVWDYDEEVEKQEEYVFAVLGRAQAIYDKYLKK